MSRALLLAVGEGRSPAALRLYDPGDVVAFSLLDRVQPGFREAVAAARAQGFDAVLRLAGGRAAVFTRETLGFAWCVPDPEPRATIARALRRDRRRRWPPRCAASASTRASAPCPASTAPATTA